jgi:hypothetical protein
MIGRNGAPSVPSIRVAPDLSPEFIGFPHMRARAFAQPPCNDRQFVRLQAAFGRPLQLDVRRQFVNACHVETPDTAISKHLPAMLLASI